MEYTGVFFSPLWIRLHLNKANPERDTRKANICEGFYKLRRVLRPLEMHRCLLRMISSFSGNHRLNNRLDHYSLRYEEYSKMVSVFLRPQLSRQDARQRISSASF